MILFARPPIKFVACVAILACSTQSGAAPIVGMTYTYDLSLGDSGPGGTGIFTAPHAFGDDTVGFASGSAQITSKGWLTDGNPGSLTTVMFGQQSVVFANGTHAGFVNHGFGGASQPKVDLVLGGSYTVNSLTLNYLIEDSTSIYAPQPVPDGSGGNLFNAVSVSGSTDGTNYSVLGFSNDFTPVFGLNGDFGSGLTEVRSITIPLGGAVATHVSVSVHTPYSFIFLSEIVVDGSAATASADFNTDSHVDGRDFLIWQRGFGVGGSLSQGDANGSGGVDGVDLDIWKSQFGVGGAAPTIGTVPEPATALLGICLLIASGPRWIRGLTEA